MVENLHPLCTHHHQLKTAGIIGLRRLAQDEIVWVLPMGVKSTTVPLPIGETDAELPPAALLDQAREADAVGGTPIARGGSGNGTGAAGTVGAPASAGSYGTYGPGEPPPF